MSVLLILFLSSLFIQLVFFLSFIVAFSKKHISAETRVKPVSVVVCAHDEEENLKALVPLLLAQNHPQFELIVVNDRSNDGTSDFLRVASSKDSRLKIVTVDHLPGHVNGKKYGITLAVKAAKYEIILLTDADCRPSSDNWISSMSSCFKEETQLVLGCSPYLKENGFLNLFIRFETIFTAMQYTALALLGKPYMGVGRNLAYTRNLFLSNKGFNGHLRVTGGDDDLFVNEHANHANTRVCMGEDALVFSKPKQSWGDFFRQKVRHLAVGKHYRFQHRMILGFFGLTYLLTWISGIALIFISSLWLWIIGAMIFRSLIFIWSIYLTIRRQGYKFEYWSVFLLDFVFVFYYLSTGTAALVTRKVKWKT